MNSEVINPDELPEPHLAVDYKNLLDKLDVSPDQVQKLYEMKFREMQRRAFFITVIIGNGGNIHRTNAKETAKRRAANKVAAKQRKVNRGN